MLLKLKSSSLTIFLLLCFLSGCATTGSKSYTKTRRYPLIHDKAPAFKVDVKKIPRVVPKKEPLSKRGNPKSYVVLGRRYYVLKKAQGYHARGVASWYGMKFHHFETSNGDIYNVGAFTAAHKTLPLPTYVSVRNLENGKTVVVKVNDRGPFVANRLIDLSYAAAKKLDMLKTGTARVEIRAIHPGITRLAQQNTSKRKKRTALATVHHTKTKLPQPIYLGIFKQRHQAQQLALLVKQWTPSPVKVEKKSIHKRTYYQVVIQPPTNHKSEVKLRQQLRLAGLTTSSISSQRS